MSDAAPTISPPEEWSGSADADDSSIAIAPVDLLADSTEPLLDTVGAEPVPPVLRDLARPGPEYDPAELEEAVASRKVIVVGNRGIPVGTLVALGLSLLFNGLFVAVMVLAFLDSPWLPKELHLAEEKQPGDESDGGGGGKEHTLMILGDDAPLTGADPAPNLGALSAGTVVPPPVGLPAAAAPTPTQSVASMLPGAGDSAQNLSLIGIPADGDHGVPRSAPPAFLRPAPPPQPVGPSIVGPATVVIAPPLNTSTTPPSGTSSLRQAGSKPGGYNPADDDDDGQVYQIGKPGNGDGGGSGTGLDRGQSGANNEKPGIISIPQPDVAMSTLMRLGRVKVAVLVTVLADGTAGDIKILNSSGDADVDAAVVSSFAHGKYRAAYRNGRSFTSKFAITYSIGGGG